MTAFSSFYPWVLPYVHGCPTPMVEQALRDAAREFCRRTKLWIDQADPVTADGSTRQFTFDFPTGAELVVVTRCTVGGDDMTIMSSRDMPSDWMESSPDTTALDDAMVVLNDNSGYVLYPTPAAGAAIVVYQSLMPTITATDVGDVIYTDYGEQMAQGAKYRLLSMPKKPWTDMESAAMAAAAFERAIHSAADRVARQRRLRTRLSPL